MFRDFERVIQKLLRSNVNVVEGIEEYNYIVPRHFYLFVIMARMLEGYRIWVR